jgi:hypothetical protein
MRRVTGILGDTEWRPPLLKIDRGASTAVDLAAGSAGAGRSQFRSISLP